jgi:hypothetical protein
MTKKAKRRRQRQSTSTVLEVVDSSGLTDADWTTINKLRRTIERGGEGFAAELKKLERDPLRYVRVIGAIFPDMVREAIRDALAEKGISADDLSEIIEKRTKPARLQ